MFLYKALEKSKKNDRIYSDLSEIIAFKRNEKFGKNFLKRLNFPHILKNKLGILA